MVFMRRAISSILVVCLLGVGFPANAGMISTDAALSTPEGARVLSVLERADVLAQLRSLGVKPEDVTARVAALSNAEIAQLADQLDQLPAGGDGGTIIGIAVLVFIILVFTDLMGWTKIFPFTKKAT